MSIIRILRLPRTRETPAQEDNPMSGDKLFAYFREQGVSIETLNPYERPLNPLARQHPLLSGIDLARSLRVLSLARHYDAVLTAFESPALLPLLLRSVSRFRAPIVMVDVGLAPGWKLRDRILDAVIPRIDGIITLGRCQIEYIQGRWAPRALVTFIHMQVDTEFYQPTPFAANGPILTVGDDVGRDFRTLLEAVDGLKLNLVAKTSQPVPSAPYVRKIQGRLSWTNWREMFAQARFVAVPVRNTLHASGVGTLLEAMAMGKPIVISDSAGIRDYVIPDQTALVVPCGNIPAMREAIIRLSTDDHLCQHLAVGARKFVEEHCSFQANSTATVRFLRQIIARSSS